MKRILAAVGGLRVPGNGTTKLANMIVAFVWRKNTLNYLRWVGKPPNYVRPVSWSEKMQWRKVFDHNPLFAIFADKIQARRWAERRVPDLRFPRFIWTGDRSEAIPFDQLTVPCVIKPNRGSGNVLLFPDPAAIDRREVIGICNRWLAGKPYGRNEGEWGYQHVRQQILIEEFLPGLDPAQKVSNYKFFVFSGQVRFVQLESTRNGRYHLTFFTRDGKRWPVRKWIGRLSPDQMPGPDLGARLPAQLPLLIDIAEALGAGIDHVRVDLYCVEGEVYFSELTPYDGSGYSYLYDEAEDFAVQPSYRLDIELGQAWVQPTISLGTRLKALLWD